MKRMEKLLLDSKKHLKFLLSYLVPEQSAYY